MEVFNNKCNGLNWAPSLLTRRQVLMCRQHKWGCLASSLTTPSVLGNCKKYMTGEIFNLSLCSTWTAAVQNTAQNALFIYPAYNHCGQLPLLQANTFQHCLNDGRYQTSWTNLLILIHRQSFSESEGSNLVLTSYQYNLTTFVTLLAHRRILIHWNQTQSTDCSAFMKDVTHHLHLEKNLIERA